MKPSLALPSGENGGRSRSGRSCCPPENKQRAPCAHASEFESYRPKQLVDLFDKEAEQKSLQARNTRNDNDGITIKFLADVPATARRSGDHCNPAGARIPEGKASRDCALIARERQAPQEKQPAALAGQKDSGSWQQASNQRGEGPTPKLAEAIGFSSDEAPFKPGAIAHKGRFHGRHGRPVIFPSNSFQ